jgi:hypothetical protein
MQAGETSFAADKFTKNSIWLLTTSARVTVNPAAIEAQKAKRS